MKRGIYPSIPNGARMRRGLTMLEMLVAVVVATLIALSTMTVIGEGRALRERARHRAELALIAQGELDRLRAAPLAQLAEGRQAVSRKEWPASVAVSHMIRKREDGFLELSVEAERQAPGSALKLALTTIHPGGCR